MSLVSLKDYTLVPDFARSAVSTDVVTIDAWGERLGNIAQISKTGNIEKIHFRLATVTEEDLIKASIQGVNAYGFPNGVIASSGTVSFADTDDNTWQVVTLAAPVAVTQGQLISIVIEYADNDAFDGNLALRKGYGTAGSSCLYFVTDIAAPLTSGSLVVGNSYFIRTYVSDDDFTNVGAASNAAGVMFTATGTTPTHWAHESNLGTWLKTVTFVMECLLEYDDDSFCYAYDTGLVFVANQSVGAATTPDEIGNYIKVPFPCRAVGIWCYLDYDYDVTLSLLLGADDTLLANCTLDADVRVSTAGGVVQRYFDGDPATTVILAKDTWYRIIATPGATAHNFHYSEVPEAAAMDALPLGQYCIWTQRTDGGAWAQTVTKRATMGLIIDQIDDGGPTNAAIAEAVWEYGNRTVTA
jgi:hypothetical protein